MARPLRLYPTPKPPPIGLLMVIFKLQQKILKVKEKVPFSLMAIYLPRPPPPLNSLIYFNGPAIKKRTFFAASLKWSCKMELHVMKNYNQKQIINWLIKDVCDILICTYIKKINKRNIKKNVLTMREQKGVGKS